MRLFSDLCRTCAEPLGPSQPLRELGDFVLHDTCVRCDRCGADFAEGQPIRMQDGMLLCDVRAAAQPRRRARSRRWLRTAQADFHALYTELCTGCLKPAATPPFVRVLERRYHKVCPSVLAAASVSPLPPHAPPRRVPAGLSELRRLSRDPRRQDCAAAGLARVHSVHAGKRRAVGRCGRRVRGGREGAGDRPRAARGASCGAGGAAGRDGRAGGGGGAARAGAGVAGAGAGGQRGAAARARGSQT